MTALQYILWDPESIAFSLFGYGVRWYSICWALALLCGYLTVQKLYQKQSLDEKLFEPLFLYCFIGIIAGARLGHCLFYEPGYFLAHPIEMFLPIRDIPGRGWVFTGYTGLASHGGTLGLSIALLLYARKTHINILRVLDNIAIATPIAAFFIRMGNLMNSEIIGRPTEVPWAFIFQQVDMQPRHPGQLYEALCYFVFFGILAFLYHKNPKKVGTGFFFGLCLSLIFTARFFIEFTKDIQVDFENSMLINMGQLLSIPFIIIGIYCVLGGKWCRKFSEKQ